MGATQLQVGLATLHNHSHRDRHYLRCAVRTFTRSSWMLIDAGVITPDRSILFAVGASL